MQNPAHKVIGFQVDAQHETRAVRLDFHLEANEVLNIELPLAAATRLTDHLVDVEFRERYRAIAD